MNFLAHLSNFANVRNGWLKFYDSSCERTKIASVCLQLSRYGLRYDRSEYFVGCNVILWQWYERNHLKALVILPGLQQRQPVLFKRILTYRPKIDPAPTSLSDILIYNPIFEHKLFYTLYKKLTIIDWWQMVKTTVWIRYLTISIYLELFSNISLYWIDRR